MATRRNQTERAHYIALLNELEYSVTLFIADVERKLALLRAVLLPPPAPSQRKKQPRC